MNSPGRPREIGALRSALDRDEPSFIRVSGPAGVGKTSLVRSAVDGFRSIHHICPPLPDPSQREALARTLSRASDDQDTPHPGEAPEWTELMSQAAGLAAAGSGPLVLILDDAHRLTEARSRLAAALSAALRRGEPPRPPLHVLAVGRPGIPSIPGDGAGAALDLSVGPLTFRTALPQLPGNTPRAQLEAYAVFGGSPSTLRRLDPQAGLATNVRRLMLEPGAPLADHGTAILEQSVQTPSRYAAILATLAQGETTWSTVHAGVTDLTTSGQVAPYLKKMEEMGLIEVRRSLDARAKSRNRRYRIVDPLLSFWYRLAAAAGWRLGDPDVTDGRTLRDVIQAQVTSVFPEVCRQYMDHDAMELLGHNARECGSLWGAHIDLDVAGILRSGAAFYGQARWDAPPTPGDLRRMDAVIRETRYGFGREARLRLFFSGEPPTPEADRAAARRHDTVLVTLSDLAGDEPKAQ